MDKKNKSIIIDGELHSKFKNYCKGKSMKIGGVVEDLIRVFLKKPKDIQREIDEMREGK